LVEIAPSLPPDRANAAWDELYAAEGSDWFWWYGDDFETDFKQEFDRLFRTHLRNVWAHMGLPPPEQLNQPICALGAVHETDPVTQPRALLSPTLDGGVTDFFEWRGAGMIDTQPPLGAMWKADSLFTSVQFGWNQEWLFLRFDVDQASEARQPDLRTDISLQSLRAHFRITFSLNPAEPLQFLLSQATGPEIWQEIGTYRSIARNTIIELALPYKDLHLEPGQEVKMWIVVLERNLEVARYPYQQPAVLTVPGPEFDAAMWRV
jgi:hypothetical protein